LLILTDGIISDMEPTIDEIVRASALPISIIIVGVGNENFDNMKVYLISQPCRRLDADKNPLYSRRHRKKMERDIVQFVPFKEFRSNGLQLAKQTLEEIPDQLLSYMNCKGIVPTPARSSIQESMAYARSRKTAFVRTVREMGFTPAQIEPILAKGLPEESVDLFVSLSKSNFTNPLSELNAFYKPLPEVPKP
jgi:hypothetical protein